MGGGERKKSKQDILAEKLKYRLVPASIKRAKGKNNDKDLFIRNHFSFLFTIIRETAKNLKRSNPKELVKDFFCFTTLIFVIVISLEPS